jgi:hypothetical protein
VPWKHIGANYSDVTERSEVYRRVFWDCSLALKGLGQGLLGSGYSLHIVPRVWEWAVDIVARNGSGHAIAWSLSSRTNRHLETGGWLVIGEKSPSHSLTRSHRDLRQAFNFERIDFSVVACPCGGRSNRSAARLCATLSGMPKHLDVVAILKRQLKEAKATVGRLHQAVRALERLGRTGRRRARKLSAAGRKRIAAAQKARWKKFRLVKK